MGTEWQDQRTIENATREFTEELAKAARDAPQLPGARKVCATVTTYDNDGHVIGQTPVSLDIPTRVVTTLKKGRHSAEEVEGAATARYAMS